jgi:transposase
MVLSDIVVGMYIAKVPNRNSPPAFLLREGYREDGKVKTRTLANLSKLPPEAIAAVAAVLKGESLVQSKDAFEAVASFQHGHVEAVLGAMSRLGFAKLIASRPSRQRNLVVAMVVARILEPDSKLATTRSWHLTTLPALLDIDDANEDDLYAALDWLLERQDRIEKKIAVRHLDEDGIALYDLSSSYFEGSHCPLAALGHNRDGKKGKLQVNYGLLTDPRGVPVSVSVYEGNTGDSKTLLPQVTKLKKNFGIERFVLVGDRGMITQKQIDALRAIDGVDWIAALRPEAIRKLVDGGAIQMGLFDEQNLFELAHPDFPGERLVACRNPELAKRRAKKRQSLLDATVEELEKVRRMVGRGRLHGQDEIGAGVRKVVEKYKVGQYYQLDIRDDGFDFELDRKKMNAEVARECKDPERAQARLARYGRHIEAIAEQLKKIRQRINQGRLHGQDRIGVRVGKVVNKYKVAKHFALDIGDDRFDFEIDPDKVAAEAALDGIYVVRTSVAEQTMSRDDTVRSYKLLGQVERAFRSFKTLDLKVRPIRHRLEGRVRSHIFLCMLAYYVQWHMCEAWRPLLFCDEDQQAKKARDPVAPAQRSDRALQKVHSKTLDDGSEVHSFHTLLKLLSSIVRNVCRIPDISPDAPTFEVVTQRNPTQQRAYELLETIET